MFSLKNWLRGSRLKCAAVTPVGPGHAQRARECRASIEAAWREHPGPFSGLQFHFIDDGRGELGRSRARNVGVEAARQTGADWIFFLDADDFMTPRAFSIFGEYADRFDAVWGLMAIKPPDSVDYHVRFPQALTLRSVDELLLLDPFMTLLMGHFVRTSVAVDLPFDETLDAGEDFDYYIRAWEKYRCTKVAQVLSVNRSDQHSSGPRAATADQWRVSASARLAAALDKRNLQRDSDRAVAAVNRCSQEAQAFNRARHDAGADSLMSYLQTGRFEDAIDSFVLAIHFRPRFPEALHNQALAALQRREFAQAVCCLERALEQRPEFAAAHNTLGYVLTHQTDEFRKGADHVRRALELTPEDPEVMCNYCAVLTQEGRAAEALDLCETLLARHPEMHEARLNRSFAQLKLGRFDLACLRLWSTAQ